MTAALTTAVLSMAAAGLTLSLAASPAYAQALVPFDCPADGILTQTTGGGFGEFPSDVIFVDMASGESDLEFTLDAQVNAVGYNVQDGFVYGWRNTDPGGGGEIVRFGANGVIESVPTPSALGTANAIIGDVDENGHYWFQRPAQETWYQVDLTTDPPVLVASGPMTGSPLPELSQGADWSYVPGTNALYQTFYDDDTTYLYEFDRTTQEFTLVGDTGLGAIQFGATYSAPDGFLYGSSNSSGDIWRFDVTTGAATLFSEGPSADHNDGARCIEAPIPVDFGDAPDSYDTLLDSGGARHSVPGFDTDEQAAPLTIGTNVSIEPDGQPSPDANLDTFDDGVTEPLIIGSGYASTFEVTVTNDTDQPATLAGWIDLDGTGTFDAGDRSDVLTIPANSGTATYTLTFPAGTTTVDTYARFRLYAQEIADPSPVGSAAGGEVEDYLVQVTNPAIDLDKSADTDELVVGETITYTFTATNTGDETLDEVEIAETEFDGAGDMSALDCDQPAPVTLAPGAELTCTATYVVQQADVDAGSVANIAEVTGIGAESGAEVSDTDDEQVPPVPDPSLDGSKEADLESFSEPGEVITYTFAAINDGNQTLTDVTVSDDLPGLSAFDCTPAIPATLAPGEGLICTATYEVTQADVDAGEVTNEATFSGQPPDPEQPPVEDTPPPVEVPAEQTPALTLEKDADTDELVAGETITYTYVVANAGNVTLSAVELTETVFTGSGTMSGFSCDQAIPATLAPDDTLICTTTYEVAQTDVDNGQIYNAAEVTGEDPGGDPVSAEADEQVPGDVEPELTGSKDADLESFSEVGDVITYTFETVNTGNVTLSDVTVTDDLEGLSAFDCTPAIPATLAPGEELICTATYEVTQADLDAGLVTNEATFTGQPPNPNDPPTTDTPPPSEVPAEQLPAIALDKSVEPDDLVVGETVEYSFVASNTGNVTLSEVSIEEVEFTGAGDMSALECDQSMPATLAPEATLTCTASYVVEQADLDVGVVDNTAEVTGLSPAEDTVSDEDSAQVPGEQEPSIEGSKSADPESVSEAGEIITYTFEAVNTGNVTLTGVNIDDSLAGLSAFDCDQAIPATLAPGEELICTATYEVTQADIDAGVVENSATFTGQPPDPDEPPVEDTPPPTQVPAQHDPLIALDKTADTDDLVAGESITYGFLATNTGNVSLSGVVISETLHTGTGQMSDLACDVPMPAELAPQEQLACVATYEITQADVDTGQIHNEAQVTGESPAGEVVQDADDEQVPGDVEPELTGSKSADYDRLPAPGEVVTFTFDAMNTGDVTLTEVTVSDELTGLSELGCAPGIPATLAPGEGLRCTATYEVTQADVDAGGITNEAYFTGLPPNPNDPPVGYVPPPVQIPADYDPGLTLEKTSDIGNVVVGETVTYTFVATNTGNVTLSEVTISEVEFTGVGAMSPLECDQAMPAILAPGAVLTCTATYQVQAADSNGLENTAEVSGLTPGGDPVTAEAHDPLGGLSPPLAQTGSGWSSLVGTALLVLFVGIGLVATAYLFRPVVRRR